MAESELSALERAEMARFYGAAIRSDLVIAENMVRQARQADSFAAHEDARLLGLAACATLDRVAGLLAFTYAQQVYVAQATRRLGVA